MQGKSSQNNFSGNACLCLSKLTPSEASERLPPPRRWSRALAGLQPASLLQPRSVRGSPGVASLCGDTPALGPCAGLLCPGVLLLGIGRGPSSGSHTSRANPGIPSLVRRKSDKHLRIILIYLKALWVFWVKVSRSLGSFE